MWIILLEMGIMLVKQLQLHNFRNFKNLRVQLGAGVNVFVGKNGQGKTNLIESIYLLTRGQSFRPTKTDSYLHRENHTQSPQGFAHLRVSSGDLEDDLKVKLEGSRKTYLRNNKRITSTQLVKEFPVVLFSPESLNSIKNGPEERRILVDDWLVLLDPKQASLIQKFRRLLKSRNKVLRDIKLTEGSIESKKAVLASINELYFPVAAELTINRISALKKLQPGFSKAIQKIFNRQDVDISVDYQMSSHSVMHATPNLIREMIIERAEELHKAELDSGLSLVGPHKHDIQFLMFGEDSRYYCSQGQQRALILAFKMAQIIEFNHVFNDYPLLMLDDVLSELDEENAPI
ncbi:MAG: DNA replication and repair protein RecF [Bdellovibrionales bacterium]